MDIRKFIKSFGYAIEGMKLAIQVDQNVRFHLVIGSLIFLTSIILKVNTFELLFILCSIFFVLITEMVNTAIEEMTNLIVNEHKLEAKIAKDVAAAAVLLSAIFAAVVGIIILLPKFLLVIGV